MSAAYVIGATGPVWGLGWGSAALAPFSAILLVLLAASAWRLLRTGRSYPKTDIEFIIPLIAALNIFCVLLGPDGHWVKPMFYLLVALSSLYYPLSFNLSVAALIFLQDAVGVFLSPARPDLESLTGLGVFGAYLAGTALVLGRVFQAEHKKRERAMLAVKRLNDGARSIRPEDNGPASIESISPEGRASRLMDSAAELDQALDGLLGTIARAIPSGNVVLFMAGTESEGVYIRLHAGEGRVVQDAVIQPGQGLVGWVVKEKKPLLVHDEARGLGYLKKEEAVRSFLAAPILNGGFLEGVIALDSPDKDAYDENDRETLNRFAALALYLLQSAREHHEVGLSAESFAALHSISSEMSASLDLATILERLAELIRDIARYDYLTISFVEGEGQAVFKVLKGYDGVKLPQGPVPLDGSYLGWMVNNAQKLSFTDMDRRAEGLPIFAAAELQTDCRSFLGLPLLYQGRALGALTIAMKQKDAISAYQQHMLSVIADQVAVNVANARLHHTIKQMATTDGLTGLINHRHFQEKADERFLRAARFPQPISVLLFDIDHFKKVNDTYGHPVGDAVLKKVSGILRDTVRAVDIAARYGGEEFIALLDNTDKDGALKMAERIRSAIEGAKFVFEGKRIPVTISAGSATSPDDAPDKKAIIEKADQALYYSKRNGRNKSSAYTKAMSAQDSNNS